jgi:tmRNA-binding protein
MAKLEIGLCRGKKHMTNESLKEQDTKRDLAREERVLKKGKIISKNDD